MVLFIFSSFRLMGKVKVSCDSKGVTTLESQTEEIIIDLEAVNVCDLEKHCVFVIAMATDERH